MRLQRIDALRYGALEQACLESLGEGLTVVLGPNESGKSTYTSLVRHVLYGYPDKRAKERAYRPLAGDRAARLTFADSAGSWEVTRVEGAKGGSWSAKTLSGPERPDPLGEVIGGVSDQTFRIVFGFGVEELAEIANSDSSDVVARLYAASAGLAVDPLRIRGELDARASAIYASRAQKPQLNTAASQMRELKDRIRDLSQQASEFTAEQARLHELDAALDDARVARDALERRATALGLALQRSRDLGQRLEQTRKELSDLEAEIAGERERVDRIDVDDAMLDSEARLTALLDDAQGMHQRVEAARDAGVEAARLEREMAAITDAPPDFAPSASDAAELASWTDRLAKAEVRAEDALRIAAAAEARAAQESETAAALGADTGDRTTGIIGLALIFVGVAMAVGGGVIGQFVGIAGLIAAGLGVWLFVRSRRGSSSKPTLETARATAEASVARAAAEEAQAELAATCTEWQAWLDGLGLRGIAAETAVVRIAFDRAAQRLAIAHQLEQTIAAKAAQERYLQTWIRRLAQVAEPLGVTVDESGIDQAFEVAAVLKTRLAQAGAALRERTAGLAALQTRDLELAKLRSAASQAETELAAVATEWELGPGDPADALAAELAATERDRDEARTAHDERAAERGELAGRLQNEGRTDAMARARQELEGLQGQAQALASDYVRSSLAVLLLDRARERYERERQPEVVKAAARVFAQMTHGRYADVRVPLDGSGISVIGANGSSKVASELSRGTAAQLYLALRIGLLESLGDTGRHLPVLMDDVIIDFDEDRRVAAAEAISELAAHRQVLFFTCHTQTAALLHSMSPGAVQIALDRCAL